LFVRVFLGLVVGSFAIIYGLMGFKGIGYIHVRRGCIPLNTSTKFPD
jgi:hypothetical protein